MSEGKRNSRIDASVVSRDSPYDLTGGEEHDVVSGPFLNPVPDWDRFRITDFVGAGNVGRVYRAVDCRLNRSVALKFLRSEDSDQVRRFQREARSQARINHDHVCRIYDVGEVDGRPYIAMQFIDGRPLTEIAEKLTLESKVRLMEQVARAAHAAHSIGVIHRDLKPENIMVEEDENGGLRAFVLDFGVAREIGDQAVAMRGMAVGTPAYMAPEQVRGDPDLIDRRVDVYGIGATLYDLIAGGAPFSGSTRIETLMRVVVEEPRPLQGLENRVPVDLETIVLTCLERDPQRRYSSALALADDLRRFLDGESIAARRSGLAFRFARYLRRLVG